MYGMTDALPNADEVVIKRKLVTLLLRIAREAGFQYLPHGWDILEEVEECLKSR